MEAIKTHSEALSNAWQAASQEMYQATQEGQSGAESGGTSANAEEKEVTDVEFEEVEDK